MGLILSFFAIVLLVAADQGIKIWAITVLQEKGTMPFLHIGNWKIPVRFLAVFLDSAIY